MITIHDFYKFFLIFGQGGAVAIGPIGPMGLMGLMGIPLREQRLGSMVVALLARLQEAM